MSAPSRQQGTNRPATNWSGHARAYPAEFARPASTAELSATIDGAVRAGRRIRIIGAGHSFTPIALGEGTVINLDELSGIVSVDPRRKRVRLRAGTRLRDIPKLLAAHGLALMNQGDVNPQSVAGAVSTGTHGTGLGYTGFAGMVTGLTLLTADGQVRELSADQSPEIFDFARLSLGVLGCLLDVELQCVDAFDLVAREESHGIAELTAELPELARAHDHVEFYWFPHSDRALLKTNTRVAPGQAAPGELAAVQPRNKLIQWLSEEVVDNGALRAICEIGMRAPALVPAFNRLATAALSNRSYRAPAHDVFVSPRRVRFNEMEYAIPLESGPEALAEVRSTIEAAGWPVSFPIEVRVAAADDVPLSTASGRQSMYIAFHRFFKEDFHEYFRRMEAIMGAYGGRPHWGKLHTLSRTELAQRYPRFEEFCALREQLDPHAVFGNRYTDSLFRA